MSLPTWFHRPVTLVLIGLLVLSAVLGLLHLWSTPYETQVGLELATFPLDDVAVAAVIRYPGFKENSPSVVTLALNFKAFSKYPSSKSPRPIVVGLTGQQFACNPTIVTVTDSDLQSAIASGKPLDLTFEVVPLASGALPLQILVTRQDGGSEAFSIVATVAPTTLHATENSGKILAAVAGIALAIFWIWVQKEKREQYLRSRIQEAEVRAENAPEKAKFAWDLARVKLEAYFDRNLSQVNQIFYVAVAAMVVGFGFVLWGVLLAFGQPKITPTSAVAAVSGIITQFIGASFMLVYRSTMAQANKFMLVLERINSVGMAVQILDVMADGPQKDESRSAIARLLLSVNVSVAEGNAAKD